MVYVKTSRFNKEIVWALKETFKDHPTSGKIWIPIILGKLNIDIGDTSPKLHHIDYKGED